MIVRCLGVGLAAVLALGALTGCTPQPKPYCKLNSIEFSPAAFVMKNGRAREIRADVTLGSLGLLGVQDMKLDISDLTLGEKFKSPPPGVNAAIVLMEGHHYRVSAEAVLTNGRQVPCGTRSGIVPISGPSTPVVTPTLPASTA